MNRFQLVEITDEQAHAGSKATADAAAAAEKLGFTRVPVSMDTTADTALGKLRRQIGYFRDYRKAEKTVTPGSILLLQHPFHHQQLTREKTLLALKKKGVRMISLVHDVEELRAFRYSDYYRQEFDRMLELADVLIVHNEVMKQWFIARGVPEERLVSLEIFDYLQDCDEGKQISFEKSITIAGNLDTEKCGYIGALGELSGVRVHLYGPNFNEKLLQAANVEYHGSFPAGEIPKKLTKGFGLVWDGSSIDGCLGESGQYLRYNNPHKLSLYLSSGLPVVISKDAAEAGFVREHGAGILVGGLRELDRALDLSEEEYRLLAENVKKLRKALCSGAYMEAALKKAVGILGQNAERVE